MTTYKRAIKLKSFATKSKRNKINALIFKYRKQVNLFLSHCYNNPNAKLDALTLASVPKIQDLSERYKSNALKQALALCKSAKSKPKFNGFPVLDRKFVTLSNSNNSFDLWLRLSTLKRGKPINIPLKKHKRLNHWLSKGQLIQGCELRPNGIIAWVELEASAPSDSLKIGIDIGMNKLITTNYGEKIGCDFNKLNAKILRKRKNSIAYKKAIKEKNNYINFAVNQLPWGNLSLLCYENLKNITKGKKRYKNLRIKQQYWSHRKVIDAVKTKSQEHSVRLVHVNPAYTSQMCSSCGNIAASNRQLQNYSCSCGFTQDADVNGAKNVLAKGLDWIESLKSSNNKKLISSDI